MIYEAICKIMRWFLESKIGDHFGHDLQKVEIPESSTGSVEDVLATGPQKGLQAGKKIDKATRSQVGHHLADDLVSKTPMRHQWYTNKEDSTKQGIPEADVVLKAKKPKKGKSVASETEFERLETIHPVGIPIQERHWRLDRPERIQGPGERLSSEVYCYQLVSWVQDPTRSCSDYIENFGEQSHGETDSKLCTGEGLENRCVFGYLGIELMTQLGMLHRNVTIFPARTALASSKKRNALQQTHRAVQFLQQKPIEFSPPESSDIFEYLTKLETNEGFGILTLITSKNIAPQKDIREHSKQYDNYHFIYIIYEEVAGVIEITSVEPVIFFSITGSDIFHHLAKDDAILGYYQQHSEHKPLSVLKTADKPSQRGSTSDDDPGADEDEVEGDQDIGTLPHADSEVVSSTSQPQDMIQYNPYDINQRLPMVEITGQSMTPTQYLLGNEFKSHRNLYEPDAPHQLVGRIVTKLGEKQEKLPVTIEWTS